MPSFSRLAERLCRNLNEAGIPYCNGYCMAVNPLWRKTLPQWIAQIGQWTRKSSLVSVRLADIFFDFQPVWGQTELAHELRHVVTGLVRNNRSFLRKCTGQARAQPWRSACSAALSLSATTGTIEVR